MSGHDPSWLPFLYSVSSSGFFPVQNAKECIPKANQRRGAPGHIQKRNYTYSSKWAWAESFD